MPLKAAELAEAITDLIAHTGASTGSTENLGQTGEMEAVK